MALTKLNASAPPYHSRNRRLLSPPRLPLVPAWHPAPSPLHPPVVVFYPGSASFPVPAPPYPCLWPPPQQATAAAPSLCKTVRPFRPHGCAPHKMMASGGDGVETEKLKAQAAAVTVKARQEPAAATGPRPHGQLVAPPCGKQVQQQQAGTKARSEEYRRRQAEPVARTRPARSPSPVFTTRPPSPMPAPEWLERPVTTVMIRNIPNKLTPGTMMKLLDDHCARANKKEKRGDVRSAYDFLYLRMDFSVCSSNMGYAFVNLTTADAARRLHCALHGSRWKVFGSKKVIDIRAARIQGKEALVRHFSSSTFACHTDEYLPAVFSPPRDGAAEPSPAAKHMHVGRRVPPPPPPEVQLTPAPRQQMTWRPVCTEQAS